MSSAGAVRDIYEMPGRGNVPAILSKLEEAKWQIGPVIGRLEKSPGSSNKREARRIAQALSSPEK